MTKTLRDLNDHIVTTYHCLRYGIGALGIAFPLVFIGRDFFANVPLQHSLSAYYCKGGEIILMKFPIVVSMGNVFVGILCSVGFGLILYKGFTYFEDWALNLAGFFVILAAFIPTKTCLPSDKGTDWHLICAGLFFLFHAYVCIFRASDTLSLMPTKNKILKNRYRRIYLSMGIAMVVLPLLSLAKIWLIIPETIAVCVFGLYWIVKGFEIQKSTKIHQRLIKGRLYIEYGLSDILKLQICVKRKLPASK